MSVGGQEGDRTFGDVLAKRVDTNRRMTEYLRGLSIGKGWKPYHSIVRGMEIHDQHRFSIDQYVTILVARNKRDMDKWIGKSYRDARSAMTETKQ